MSEVKQKNSLLSKQHLIPAATPPFRLSIQHVTEARCHTPNGVTALWGIIFHVDTIAWGVLVRQEHTTGFPTTCPLYQFVPSSAMCAWETHNHPVIFFEERSAKESDPGTVYFFAQAVNSLRRP